MKSNKTKSKNLRKNKSSLDLVPTYTDYSDIFRNGKEKLFKEFFEKTSPDSLSRDCMKKYLNVKTETLKEEAKKDGIVAKDIADKIVLLQQSELQMITNRINDEILLQKYIMRELKEGGNNHEK